ncbi:MAG TPA: N-acetylmuramoyl-L-alanine amidase [Thermoanaerobaculia bacterium]|nr:N-acetylmuramoyl-L-alanine amidase [Thermoanaerobaculia bacterium]
MYNEAVRVWWGIFLVFLPATLLASGTRPDLHASLTKDYEIEVVVRPHEGDAWTRLAQRLTGDAGNWKTIAGFNGAGDTLLHGMPVRIPFALLRPDLQRRVVQDLFPLDQMTPAGWRHVVVGDRGIEGESLWKIAEWFTGDGVNYGAIRKANPGRGLSTRKGDVIVIPGELLVAAFRGGAEGEHASKAGPAEVRQSEDDPVERATANEDVAEAAAEVVAVGQPSLTYVRNAAEPYAIYRLQKGEALYSSVGIRFTGRVYARDVNEVLERIVKFNGIDDVAKIPVGYPVKIPMDLLLAEYRPGDDPARLAREASIRESSRLAKRTRARNLSGVHVILDAGHGGRDVGTYHDGVAESRYVYDVVCRLKEILEKKTGAKVSVTTKSKSLGYRVVNRDQLETNNDHVVLTTPRYSLEDAVVGVNLRWYLANSIFRSAMRGGVEKEKVVFISIHADSLHPALRGAMAYIPGERYIRGSYRKSGEVYLARAEVRERPIVSHSAEESLLAEGLSRELAEAVIGAFDGAGLKVHPFHPVRDSVVRDGREWVPAIIRYNVVPTRMLLEICNLGNEHDRKLMKTKKYRQQVAEAVHQGLLDFFAGQRPEEPPMVAAKGAR